MVKACSTPLMMQRNSASCIWSSVCRRNGFAVLDCQQQTPHMERFGAYEIDEASYARLLTAPC